MSDARSRFESAALIATALCVVAFIASFIVGVANRPEPEAPPVSTRPPLPATPGVPRGRVEVMNATGRAGLARAAAMQLRDAGFDVVDFGTARTQRDSSIVFDRIGKIGIAQAAGAALHITAVKTQLDTTLFLDATVIVGKDWQKRQVAQQQQPTGWKATVKRWLGR